jgi:tRNA dimethylallyltransferase
VAGGTGQYVRALLEGWQAPAVPPDPALRAELEARAAAIGAGAFHAELARLDPDAAAAIDPRNVRRVVRAMEVIRATGQPFSAQRGRSTPPFDALVLGIAVPRDALYERIDRRVDAMMAAGLRDEVEALRGRGYDCSLPAMNSIGYAEMCAHLDGALTLDEAVARIKTGTHRLARTQGAWFRAADPRITWLNGAAGLPVEDAVSLVSSFLHRAG